MANDQSTPLILVVDDESGIRELERRVLERAGYRVIEASGGLPACAMLASGTAPDLVIADLDMPDLTGEDMVLRIHATRPHQKVLYVTANIGRLLDVRSIVWEGEAFLEKPFTAKGLQEAVSLLLTGTLTGKPVSVGRPRRKSFIPSLVRRFRGWRTNA